MLDREYLNWIISNSDFKELKGIGDFMDEEVLKRVPVELDEFKNAISDYIKEKVLDTLRVSRTSDYGSKTYDIYQRCKEELFRNGTNVQ